MGVYAKMESLRSEMVAASRVWMNSVRYGRDLAKTGLEFLGPTGNGRSELRDAVVPWAETGPESDVGLLNLVRGIVAPRCPKGGPLFLIG